MAKNLIDRTKDLITPDVVSGQERIISFEGRRPMRKLFLLAVVCAFWLMFSGSAAASDIAYNVDNLVGIGSVMGTITTNGTIGTLSNGDIVSFNLELNDGTGTADLCMGPPTCPTSAIAGSVFISGGNLTATATDLLFDFNGNGAFVNFNGPSPGCPPQLTIRTGGGTACNGASGDMIGLSAVLPPGTGVYLTRSGDVSILTPVTPVPEPGSVGLMVAGLVSLIGLGKRLF